MTTLKAYLTEASEKTYRPGLHDCATLIAGWADAVSGSDHKGDMLGTYASKWKGLERYAAIGVCPAVCARLMGCGWVVVDSADLEDGDIVLTDLDHPGIFYDSGIWAQPMGCAGSLIIHRKHAKGGLRWAS